MFRNNQVPPKEIVNCILGDGGMGDHIAALPAIKYIIEQCPWITLLVWCPDYMVDFAKHVLPKGTSVRDYSAAQNKYNANLIGITTQWRHLQTPMRQHPTDYAFQRLLDINPSIEHKNYLKIRPKEINLKRFKLPEKYVVIPVAATAKVKELPASVVNYLAFYLNTKGYTPVFLGSTNIKTGVANDLESNKIEGIDFSKGIDLTNKTNLLECAGIISGAKAFCGMEGGLMHIAGCTDTPIVAGYTFVKPEQTLPIRNSQVGYNCYPVDQPESLECRYCQSNMVMVFNHDFRECFYDDLACVSNLTPDRFIAELEKVL